MQLAVSYLQPAPVRSVCPRLALTFVAAAALPPLHTCTFSDVLFGLFACTAIAAVAGYERSGSCHQLSRCAYHSAAC